MTDYRKIEDLSPEAQAAMRGELATKDILVDQVTIILHRRGDGGLRVYSDDVPGLILSGPDPAKVMLDVWPALVAIQEYRK